MAQFVTHNAAEVAKSIKATRQQTVSAMHYANKRTADAGVNYTRRFIPPPRGNGAFPGYKARGPLRDAVQSSGPHPIAGGVRSDIYMASNTSKPYQRIHEFGGIIRARAGGWLRFPKPPGDAPRSMPIPGNRAFEKDGFVFAKAVRIRPKRYWSSGWAYGVKRFGLDFQRFFNERLKTFI